MKTLDTSNLQVQNFNFADSLSTLHASYAWHAFGNEQRKFPLDLVFLIIGPPRSGKSTFVQACLRGAGAARLEFSAREFACSMRDRGFVWWDDARSKLRSPALHCMLQSQEWAWRAYRKQHLEELRVSGPVFICTTKQEEELPKDLLNRCHLIRMKGDILK